MTARPASAHPVLAFPHAWTAEILRERPPILPSRRFTYPREADEVERGALEVLVRPETAGPETAGPETARPEATRPDSAAPFLATFALGFADPIAPSGLWSCPNPDELCAVAGGYAYIVNTRAPEQFSQLAFRPVLHIEPLLTHNLLLFAGSYALLAWGPGGLAWTTPRLSSEGLRITAIEGDELRGFGWDLMADREIPFTIDLRTGKAAGSG
jgi:hypothetical protein